MVSAYVQSMYNYIPVQFCNCYCKVQVLSCLSLVSSRIYLCGFVCVCKELIWFSYLSCLGQREIANRKHAMQTKEMYTVIRVQDRQFLHLIKYNVQL